MSQSCHIKMLRYFYLLSLLICINISFCYEYTSDNESSDNLQSRKLRAASNLRGRDERRRFRKRHDYDTVYDKDPVAQIDVVNFIKSEDESLEENDPYDFQVNNLGHEKYNNDYENLNVNSNEKLYGNEDYLELDSENVHENTVGLNLDTRSIGKKHAKDMAGLDQILGDDFYTQNDVHHQQKKCALKNIKLPFFSHDKSGTTKSKKNKKRKLHGFINDRKRKVISKQSNGKLANSKVTYENQNPYKYYKLDKRSYIEKLCPACMKKFIVNKKIKSKDKNKNISKYTYDAQKNKNVKINAESVGKNTNMYKVDVDAGKPAPNEETVYEDSFRNRRRKRENDNRNIERQKELEDIERRVESVSINNAYNKIDSKS